MKRTGLIATVMLAASLGAGASAGAEQTGYLRTWGWPDHGLCDPPPGDDFVAVDGGGSHIIALRADGSIVSWGPDYRGIISDTPSGNDFTAIAACSSAALALRSDGSISVWGSSSLKNPPSGSDFIAIDGGGSFAVALRADGTLAAWAGDMDALPVRKTPTGFGFTAISAGMDHALALRTDGTIAAWGDDHGGSAIWGTPRGGGFVAISAGGYHSLALRGDGSIVAWGWDRYGQVSGVPAGNDFVAVAAGGVHSLALRSDGTIAAWGRDDYGQVTNTPTEPGFIAIACGPCSMAIGPWGLPAPAARLECSVTDLGDGLHGVTFTVRGNGIPGESFFADITFEGTGDGQIQQTQPFPGFDVNLQSQADAFNGFGEPPYDKQRDTYLLEPFSDGDIMVLEQGENYYRIAAGTAGGRAFEDAPVAYICTTGDLRYQGNLYRDGMTFPVSGFVRLPEPAATAILALGALALIRRR